MKNKIFLVIAAFLFTASVQAQTTVDSIAAKYKLIPMPEPLTIEKTFPVLGNYQLSSADASMAMANTASVATNSTTSSANTTTSTTTTPATTETAPATTVGTETASAGSLVVTLDPENKGVIWVEGLPQGKFKAYLKKSPASYRILSQKTETGNEIPEGTLLYDPSTQTLNIALGKEYDDADPSAIFALNPALNGAATTDVAPADNTVKVKVKTATSKSKSKVSYFTASKIEQTPSTSSDATPAPATTTEEQKPAQQ
jgi:hypothetical protein